VILEVVGSNPSIRRLILVFEAIKTLNEYLNIKIDRVGRQLKRNIKKTLLSNFKNETLYE